MNNQEANNHAAFINECLTQEIDTTSTKYAKVVPIHGVKDGYGVFVTGEFSEYEFDFGASGLDACLIIDWQDDLGDYMPLHPRAQRELDKQEQ